MNISYQRGNAYGALGRYQEAFSELDLVRTSYRHPKYPEIALGGYGIDQGTLHRDWELVRLLIEEKSGSRMRPRSDGGNSGSRPLRRYAQLLLSVYRSQTDEDFSAKNPTGIYQTTQVLRAFDDSGISCLGRDFEQNPFFVDPLLRLLYLA